MDNIKEELLGLYDLAAAALLEVGLTKDDFEFDVNDVMKTFAPVVAELDVEKLCQIADGN